MIKYNLKCNNGHEFESWFLDSKEFDKLNKRQLLECIYCSSSKVKKSIMSPMVSVIRKEKNRKISFDKNLLMEKKKLIQLREHVEKNFTYVGDKFSKKIREIYYDKKNNKKIYGTTTESEREQLAAEGIELISIPWLNKDN